MYLFFKCSLTNFCTLSLLFLESGYTFALLGLKSSFMSMVLKGEFDCDGLKVMDGSSPQLCAKGSEGRIARKKMTERIKD